MSGEGSIVIGITGAVGKTRAFLDEVRMEMRKSTWPPRPELVESTVVVIMTVLLLSLFVAASDSILGNVVRVLTRVGAHW